MIMELVNNYKPYIMPLAVSCAVHIGIASYSGFSSAVNPIVQLKNGRSVMELTLVSSKPSKASVASKKAVSRVAKASVAKKDKSENIKEKIFSESVDDNLNQTMSSGIKRIETKTLCCDKVIATKTEKKYPEHKKEIFAKQIENKPEKEQTKEKNFLDTRKEKIDETNQVNQQVNSVNSLLVEADMRKKGVSCECKPLSKLVVKYPRVSRRKSEQGTVDLNIKIDEYGSVVKIEIISSSGYKRLDRSAVKSLKKAKFMPAKKNGTNVVSEIKMNITFKLDDYDE